MTGNDALQPPTGIAPTAAGRTRIAQMRARASVYALFSELTRSPFRHDGEIVALPPSDLPELLPALAGKLPFEFDAVSLVDAATALDDADAAGLAAGYSSLFEVGQPGPPVPVRESLAVGDGRHVREEVVRFYEFFGYKLNVDEQWCPDHLSIQLEFLHLLAVRQAMAAGDLQHLRASRDFLARHLLSWFPATAAAVAVHGPGSWWHVAWRCLDQFLEQDRRWLESALDGD